VPANAAVPQKATSARATAIHPNDFFILLLMLETGSPRRPGLQPRRPVYTKTFWYA
jgi:hypothetical protein